MAKDPIGVIGIGAMGMAVAKNLLDRGYAVHVRDVRAEAETEARAAGAKVCASPAELARACEVVITLVVNAAQTEDIAFGEGGLAEGMASGGVVVMSSTVSPAFSATLAERLAEHELLMLDAPVSGGPARARSGEMSMMLAGPPAAFARAGEVIADAAARRFRVSDRAGDGSKMKVVNNMLAGVNLAAACEAMALAMRAGLDPQLVHDVVCASSGASWMFADRMPRVLAGDYATRAAVNVLAKDLGLLLEVAAEHDFPVPIAAVARQAYLATMGLGYADEDDCAVIKTYAALTQLQLPRR